MKNNFPSNAYDSFSSDYDRFVNWGDRLAYEMPFIRQLLETAVGGFPGQPVRVLDAACGTGRHALALADLGYRTAGSDLSPGMVAVARRNAAAAGARVDFVAAGFGELERAFAASALFPFDALLCLGNSLPHLLTPRDLAAALDDFAACLRPGGLLLIQNRNFDAVLSRRERWMEPQSYCEGNKEWIFLRIYDYEADGLITFNIVSLKRNAGEPWQQQVTSTRLNPLRQGELIAALSAAGFDHITCNGSMTGEPFDPVSSGNLVVVASVE